MARHLFSGGVISPLVLLAVTHILTASSGREVEAVAAAPLAAPTERENAPYSGVATLGTTESIGISATATPAAMPITGLAERVRRTLDKYYSLPPNTRDDSSWNLLHWSIAYGVDAQVR